MRRGTTALGTLLATAALVASWRIGTHPSSGVAGVQVVATPPQSQTGQSRTTPSTSKTKTKSKGTATTKGTTAATTQRATGALVRTPYGDVRVAVVAKGSTITDVVAVHLTDANQHSRDISAAAAPVLRREALRAQSAKIDTISGATYTSEGYRQSLQAALDQLHL